MSQRSSSKIKGMAVALLLLLATSGALLLAGIPLDFKSQCIFSVYIFSICLIVGHFKSEKTKFILIILTILVSTRYIWWRASNTLVFDDTWSAVAGYTLFSAEIYAYLVLLLGYVQTIRPLRRKPIPLPEKETHWPTVDIFIPTYNEPLRVVAATIAGAMNIEWPKNKLNIYLLDDGNRAEFRQYAANAGINYRARDNNLGAKAGNLNEAFSNSSGDLIAIFDCDQIPVRSFLQMTVGWFIKDPNLAQLQTPQHFHNPDPIEKNLSIDDRVPNEGSLFYGLIQDGNDLWNAAYFCGSCAILRRSALAEIGGIAEESVTEDAHTSILLHRKGYTSAYINVVQSAGLATESLSAHINQRIRWARGLAQVFRIDNPFIGRGLSLGQRLCYANATMHFLYAAPRLIFLLAPICFLFFDLSIIQSEAAMVAAMALPHILQNNLTAARISGHWRQAFWAEVYETVLSFYIFLPTLVALLVPSKGKFNVTQKGDGNESNYYAYALAAPFILIGLLNLLAVSIGIFNLYSSATVDRDTTILNLVWASYNLIIVGVALGIAKEKKQTRNSTRHAIKVPVSLITTTGRRVVAQTVNLSESGAHVILSSEYTNSDAFHTDTQFKTIFIDCGNGDVSFPISYVSKNNSELRLEFVDLSFYRLRSLVRLLYSPADRWIGEREKFTQVGIIRSLGRIFYMGIMGWWRLITGPFEGNNKRKLTPNQQTHNNSHKLTTVSVFLLSALIVSLFFTFSKNSYAQETNNSMAYELRLLTDQVEKTIELGTVRYGFNIPFAVRRDTVVNSGVLALNLSWRDQDNASSRRLNISINDNNLWTSPEPQGSQAEIYIPFDGNLFSDYNTLSFTLSDEGTDQCSQSSGESFELVLHSESKVSMDVTSIPIANDLDTLPLPFFDDRDPRRAVIDFVIPSAASNETLKVAGQVAAWFGALTSYRGVEFRVSTDSIPDQNSVVIAAADDLPDDLDWLDAGEPRVLLLDSPTSPEHQLLVLTAPTDQELSLSLQNLLDSVKSDHLATYRSLVTRDYEDDRMVPSKWVDTKNPIRLSELDVSNRNTLEIKENNFSPIKVSFQVPGDFHPGDGKPHSLALDYYYSPNFPNFQENLTVAINGQDVKSIDLEQNEDHSILQRLSNSKDIATSFQGTLDLDIPHNIIQANNQIELRFNAPAMVSNNCGDLDIPTVKAGIDGNTSVLDLSNGSLNARYPDLALFVNSGIPFTHYPDLRQTHIELPENPAQFHYALFLNLMSRFAAITGNEPSNISVSRGASFTERKHIIYISRIDETNNLNSELSLSPIHISEIGLEVSFTNFMQIYAAISDWINPSAIQLSVSGISRNYSKTQEGLLLSAESSSSSEGVILALIADGKEAASALQQTLTDPTRLRNVTGNIVLASSDNSIALSTGRSRSLGNLPLVQSIKWWLSENLIFTLVLVSLISLIFSLALSGFLDRVAERRLG